VKRYLLYFSLGLVAALLPSPLAQADDNPLVDAGIPALDREWNGTDYAAAVAILKSGKVPLPSLSDKQGAALLQKLVSTQNLGFDQDKNVDINSRMPDFLKLLEGVSSLLGQYGAALNSGTKLHSECAQVMAFSLKVAELGVKLGNEFLATVPHDDKYATRMEGLKTYYSGMTTMFVGSEMSLSEKSTYTDDDLSLLLESMAQTLPGMKVAFTADYKQELHKKLQADKASFSKEKDTANLQRMIDELGREKTDGIKDPKSN